MGRFLVSIFRAACLPGPHGGHLNQYTMNAWGRGCGVLVLLSPLCGDSWAPIISKQKYKSLN